MTKKNQDKEKAQQKEAPQPHAYKNTHVVHMGDRQGSQSPARSQRTIIEQDGEESEVSAMNIVTAHHKEAITKREIQEKTDVIN